MINATQGNSGHTLNTPRNTLNTPKNTQRTHRENLRSAPTSLDVLLLFVSSLSLSSSSELPSSEHCHYRHQYLACKNGDHYCWMIYHLKILECFLTSFFIQLKVVLFNTLKLGSISISPLFCAPNILVLILTIHHHRRRHLHHPCI